MRLPIFVLLGLVCLFPPLPRAEAREARENKTGKTDIYDTKADGKTLISAALERAAAEKKQVLVDLGANWCPDCHGLHEIFNSNPEIRKKLDAAFVVVMLDVNDGRNEEINLRYGNPTLRGIPVLVVLKADGTQIFTQDTGEFYTGKDYDPGKILAFLNKW